MTVYALVTGASGLVGHALTSLNTEYVLIPVSSKDADLRDLQQVRDLLKAHPEVTVIIHLAANVGGLFKNINYPVEMMEDNLLMNTNILKAAHEANIDKVVVCLSTCIFPDQVESYPMTANDLHLGPPHPSNEGYAYAKRMAEVLCRAYQRQYNRRYYCVVPTNIYGPHDNFDSEGSHIIPALIRKAYLAGYGEPLKVAGDGTPLRQFIFSEDLARIILWSLKEYHDPGPLIICPPESEVSIGTVAEIIAKKFGRAIEYDPSRPNGQYKKTVTSLDDFDYTSLEEGIDKTVKWLINSPVIRGIDGLPCV
jgi:GDP-L-fucose synthase